MKRSFTLITIIMVFSALSAHADDELKTLPVTAQLLGTLQGSVLFSDGEISSAGFDLQGLFAVGYAITKDISPVVYVGGGAAIADILFVGDFCVGIGVISRSSLYFAALVDLYGSTSAGSGSGLSTVSTFIGDSFTIRLAFGPRIQKSIFTSGPNVGKYGLDIASGMNINMMFYDGDFGYNFGLFMAVGI